MRAVSASEHIMNTIPAGVNPVALSYALRWLSRCASIYRWGRTTTYFSEGEERWSTSLGLIFKQLRT
jgi:hypothetical protein